MAGFFQNKSWRRSLRYKLVVTSVLCLLLPSLLTLWASDYLTKNIVRAQVVDNERKSLELADVYISGLFNSMIRISNSIMFENDINVSLKEIWQRSRSKQQDYAKDTLAAKYFIDDKLENIAYAMDNVYITLMTTEGQYFTSTLKLDDAFKPSDIENEPWMERLRDLPAFEVDWVGLIKRTPDSSRSGIPFSIAVARNLRMSSNETYAYLIVSIGEDQLSQIFRHDVGRQETVLLDKQGMIIASKDSSKVGKPFRFSSKVQNPDSRLVEYENESFLLSRHSLSYGGYELASLKPYKEAVSQIHTVYRLSFAIQIAAVLLFLVLFIYMVRQFTKPVIKLGQVAARVEAGDLTIRSNIRGRDEIGHLGKMFDQMLESIEWMMAEVTMEQTQKRKAELAMLQAQINPHFLFNILNSIRLRILMKGDKENAELLSSLSGLLRMTIQRDNEFTPLHEELHIVKKYVELLNFRQSEKADLEINAASDCLAVPIPRFLLQPIIENAYIHGLNQNAGLIRISAHKSDKLLTIIIEDDGEGIAYEKLELLRHEMSRIRDIKPAAPSVKLSSIGISNVYERLYLIYGNQFRLTIDSKPGIGTVLQVMIPILTTE
ncbi:sensor histidine kinase [Paenibacillus sepulcri]|uniref:Histidine kinase n=1 Tax=Paenibacillus sepulcri TaxID=359917 RepID=A0ABS7C1J9_9BACL|nr:histidine kinase [Paenibacillus sepulcri]